MPRAAPGRHGVRSTIEMPTLRLQKPSVAARRRQRSRKVEKWKKWKGGKVKVEKVKSGKSGK
jgi:hypothetical protein